MIIKKHQLTLNVYIFNNTKVKQTKNRNENFRGLEGEKNISFLLILREKSTYGKFHIIICQ